MVIPTLLRKAEHRALQSIELNGSVLDLGGDVRAEYRGLIKGNHTFTTVNLDEKTKPDIVHDLEKTLPIGDQEYDNALIMNVLEHVYNAQSLLREAARVVRPGGKVVVVVPFMFPLHPSPQDFWRFSDAALRNLCQESGLVVDSCAALGSGVCAVQFVLIDRLLPGVVRMLFSLLHPVVSLMDALFYAVAKLLRKKYQPGDYALGYVCVAHKAP